MKKHIFRLMTLCTVAVLALASCKKDNGNDGNVPEKGFRATVEQIGDNGNNGGSRTHINPENWNDGTTWPVLWTEGDQIVVYNGSEPRVFQLQSGENSNNGIFEPADGQEYDYTSGPFSAVYCPSIVPYLTEPELLELCFSGTTALVDVPQYQTYKANSFAEGGMPMSAYSDGQTLEFKNLAGGLCFPIVGAAGANIKRVVVQSLSTNDAVSGYFNVDCADATHSLTPFIYSGYSLTNSFVSLNCSEGVTLDATNPTYFTIMVAPGSLENGFRVKAYDAGNHEVYQNSVDWSANPHEGFITRGVIRKVNQNLEIVPYVEPLTVTTISPSNISTNSALGMGMVDYAPESCGILYAKASDLATPANELVVGGSNVTDLDATGSLVVTDGMNRFEAELTGLTSDIVYYVRAYAFDRNGVVSYGDPVPFATRYDYYGQRDGKSRSAFSIDANGNQVHFSMGNLQYQASTNTWRFADYQFEFVGDATQGLVYEGGTKCDNSLIAENYSGWIDLFGWGTSGINDYSPIAQYYQPWSTSWVGEGYVHNTGYDPYGSTTTDLYSNSGKADWGYNAISNGGNTQNSGWFTLTGSKDTETDSDWDYLLLNRTCQYRYAFTKIYVRGASSQSVNTMRNSEKACGTSVIGMIIFPDDFVWPSIAGNLSYNVSSNVSNFFSYNSISESQWSLLEQAGAVLLPGPGDRMGTWVHAVGQSGGYWSSTHSQIMDACYIFFNDLGSYMQFGTNATGIRESGTAVRLACPVN